MAKRVSTILGVDDAAFEATGAFNGFVDVDSLMHVDPHLLAASSAPELAGSRDTFDTYFRDVGKLLTASRRQDDRFWTEARKRLTFREIPQTALGHSKDDTGGSGIGDRLAGELTALAKAIIDAGINDPDIFDLLGLFQENVGPDRISDMTVRVILPHLLSFSERVAKTLGIPTVERQHEDRFFQVPVNPVTGSRIVLVPRDVLRPIPVAFSWSDIDFVAAHNRELRKRVNREIGATWKKATSAKTGKEKLTEIVLRYPALIKDLLVQYRDKPAAAYDFDKDPDALLLWHSITRDLARGEPLAAGAIEKFDPDSLIRVVRQIVEKFKELIETNRLYRLLYNDDGTRRHEKIAQLAFFGLADAYCEANNFDLSPEADAGVGPVDFKISLGYKYRVTVEVKLSSNPAVISGFENQLPAYNEAEGAMHSIYLVIHNGHGDKTLKRLEVRRRAAAEAGGRVPDVQVVDGRLQVSASKRKGPRRGASSMGRVRRLSRE